MVGTKLTNRQKYSIVMIYIYRCFLLWKVYVRIDGTICKIKNALTGIELYINCKKIYALCAVKALF